MIFVAFPVSFDSFWTHFRWETALERHECGGRIRDRAPARHRNVGPGARDGRAARGCRWGAGAAGADLQPAAAVDDGDGARGAPPAGRGKAGAGRLLGHGGGRLRAADALRRWLRGSRIQVSTPRIPYRKW